MMGDYDFSPEVKQALKTKKPIVALESTVITHGLPKPQNYQLAKKLEEIVLEEGAIPATIAILEGKIRIGLNDGELKKIAEEPAVEKVNPRMIGITVAFKRTGGTTVAGTLFLAHRCGIDVFATGGIGGVHRQSTFDISSDLQELSRTPMIVVCSGAKAILDLPATMEYLETMNVPVVGFQTDELPGFYSNKTGLPVNIRVDDISQVVLLAKKHWALGSSSSILLVVPPPQDHAIPAQTLEDWIISAQKSAEKKGITGPMLTPFLLKQISELSAGKSVEVNLALLQNNARIAARIARQFQPGITEKHN